MTLTRRRVASVRLLKAASSADPPVSVPSTRGSPASVSHLIFLGFDTISSHIQAAGRNFNVISPRLYLFVRLNNLYVSLGLEQQLLVCLELKVQAIIFSCVKVSALQLLSLEKMCFTINVQSLSVIRRKGGCFGSVAS